jgi:Zn-finger nucleic acid-binding protein
VVQRTIVQREVLRRVVVVEEATGKTSMPCPRCAVPLFEGKAGDVLMHGCGTCGGVWLDNVASARIANAVSPTITAMSDRAALARRAPVDAATPVKCPIDGDTLERVTVHGIELDVCHAHGTWFDAGEVRRVGEAFQSARIAAVAGPTHDYDPAAEKARENQRYAEGAMQLLAAFLQPGEPAR